MSGLRTKGIKPTKEFLVDAFYNKNRSLMDIGRELKCDPGAIKWWAREYGIELPKLNPWTQRNLQRGYSRPDKDELQYLYDSGFSLVDIGYLFGTSRQAIKDAFIFYNIIIRSSGWGNKRFICQDGHKVKSTYERKVCDWLYDHQMPHEYEPVLPFNKYFKSDFLYQNTYIEIFGVIDSDWYDKRKKYKIEQYQIHNLPVIAINYWDFDNGHKDAWIRKLNHLGNSFSTADATSLDACSIAGIKNG